MYGDSFQSCLVGVLVPDEDYLKSIGIPSLTAASEDEELKKVGVKAGGGVIMFS